MGILIKPETNKQQNKQKQKQNETKNKQTNKTKQKQKTKNKNKTKQTNKKKKRSAYLNPRLTKGGYRPLENFSLSPQNQKESDLNHLASLGKFSILAYISLKIGYFELGHGYDITVTVYLGRWYLFQYAWKEETLAILWFKLHVSEGFIF